MDYMDVMGLICFVVSFGPIAVVSIVMLILDRWKRRRNECRKYKQQGDD